MQSTNIYTLIGKVGGVYDSFLKLFGHERSVDRFVAVLPFSTQQPLEVLDAGCGTGLYTLAVLKRFPNARVTSFDLSPALVNRLREKLVRRGLDNRATLFTANIQGPIGALQGKKFDLIITAGVLEYVPLEQTVRGLSQFLAPNGYFLNSPVANNPYGKLIANTYGCNPYPREVNLRAFEASGFTLKDMVTLPPWSLSSFKEAHLFLKS
jgi:SAM-dependent methyltransferase